MVSLKIISLEQTDGCQMGKGLDEQGEKIKKYKLVATKQPRAVERSIGNITATPEDLCTCQVGTRLIGGMTSYLVKHLYV